MNDLITYYWPTVTRGEDRCHTTIEGDRLTKLRLLAAMLDEPHEHALVHRLIDERWATAAGDAASVEAAITEAAERQARRQSTLYAHRLAREVADLLPADDAV